MIKKSQKVELLAPAGSLEKLKYAIEFGADAVYCGLPSISMRARINAFSEDDLKQATEFVHSHGKKIYVTLNIYAHNYHLPIIEKHLKFLKTISVDAIIISDPGIIMLVRKHLPKMPIHLSTQANTTNWQAAKFWAEQGVERVVLARETTLEDIAEIKRKVPKLELEYFVHGAMCMSYSGRCILSKWMSGKSANLGDCTQPCRWGYKTNFQFPISLPTGQAGNFQLNPNDSISKKNLKAEIQKPDSAGCGCAKHKTMEITEVQSGRIVLLEEDSHGTYFFNSKDLNLLSHLHELKNAGVSSFKIEGRNKSVFYVSGITRAYRKVLDAIEAQKTVPELRKIQKWAEAEIDKTVNRGYTKGFLFGNEPEHNFEGSVAGKNSQSVGEVLATEGRILKMKVHNALYVKDGVEIMTKEKNIPVKILEIRNELGELVTSAHGGHSSLYFVTINKKGIEAYSLMRKVVK
ncbi:MAG: U32 family peptidase [Candidatus Moranbacteria bacterium]|nr:U32 family peptidase [Candidatus Moranbacteria bacterium]